MENVNTCTHVPPGFRFHPSDEELVDYYLRRKVNSKRIDLDVIKEVDLYKIEPWDLLEISEMGNNEQNEWYFFNHKDKKYPTGTRTNRATTLGFWKATGRDKAIYSKRDLIGMRKTLVFYKGRAPNGQKSDWIMHEYRLETDENGPPQEEVWVVCRVFKKRTTTTTRNTTAHESPSWYHDQVSFEPASDSPNRSNNLLINGYGAHYTRKKEPDHHNHSHRHNDNHDHHLPFQIPHEHLIHIPILENSKLLLASPHGTSNCDNNAHMLYDDVDINHGNATMQQFHDNHDGAMVLRSYNSCDDQGVVDHQVTDWRVLDKFVASQLSHSNKDESMLDNASTSTSSSQIDENKQG